jgi:hypothetical protein
MKGISQRQNVHNENANKLCLFLLESICVPLYTSGVLQLFSLVLISKYHVRVKHTTDQIQWLISLVF